MTLKQLFESGVPVLFNDLNEQQLKEIDNLIYKGLCVKLTTGKDVYYKATTNYCMLLELLNDCVDDKGMLKSPSHEVFNKVKGYLK